MTPERRLQTKIVKAIKDEANEQGIDVEIIKMHGNMYSAGWPDLCVLVGDPISPPEVVFLEVKCPRRRPTARQEAKLTRLRQLGFSAEVVTSILRALGLMPWTQ